MQPAIPVALIVMAVVASSCLVAAGLGAAILQPAGAVNGDEGSVFITTWRTTTANETITIPGTGTYDVVWGDAAFDNGASGSATHTYAQPGTYMVKITGGLERINLGDSLINARKLQSIEQWGNMEWTTMRNAFSGASAMVYNASDAPDLSGVADMTSMFSGATSFDGDLSSWDVSAVTDMNGMFDGASSFNQPLNDWDVPQVTDMNGMFYSASSFDQPLNGWNVSQVTDMGNMFVSASSFNQPLSGWDVSQVTDMSYMFNSASDFNQPLSSWDVSKVTGMSSMFQNAAAFNGDVSSWNVSQVTGMGSMFFDATTFNQPLSSWDVSQVTSMFGMFYDATTFNQDISSWNVSQVINMNGMFFGATSFDQNLGNWYVVPADTAYDTSEATLSVTTISAQNSILDGHSPEYGIGSGDDSALFNMAGSTLMFNDTLSVGSYAANVTASGTNVFEGENNWRVLKITVADNIPPVITLNGANPDSVPVGSTYAEPGYSCADDTDDDKDLRLHRDDSDLDVNTPGTYTITYTCTDLSGNMATDTRTVMVVAAGPPADTTDPVITINGSSELTITAGTTYAEQGAACTDDTDGSLQVTTTGTVDTSSPGTYTVTYTCTDSSGNGSTISRTVTVVAAVDDDIPPVITLNGANPDSVPVGSTYAEPGYSCADDTDDDKDLRLHRDDSDLDVDTPGAYTVTYTCTDLSGNIAIATRGVEVVAAGPPADATDPVITINGSPEPTIQAGSTYEDAGATCTDDTDPAPTVTTSGTVDTSSPGTHTLTYACTDSSGNESTATRTVTVVAVGPPEDNNPPNVDAGADQTVREGDTVTLSGSAADPDAGDAIESYAWSAPPGSGITFADGSSASTTFTAPAVDADATFTLTLTAGDGTDSGSDDVDVTVRDTGSAFITTWRTTSDNEAITIPGTGVYDVAWGDGTFFDAASEYGEFFDGVSGHVSHEYETPGTHTVSITGGLRWINLGDNPANAKKLQSIEQWGGIKWDAMAFSFQGASNMVYNADDAPDLSEVADMTNMFRKASSFDGDLSSWDVSQVTDMSGMFTSATAFDGDVSPWDVSSVTDMSIMFTLASSFNGDLSSWNVSSATGMGHMFLAANSFQQNLGNWYVVPADTAYATSEGTLNVTTVSAQNSVLDGHSPEYGIGSGGDSALFSMTGNALMFKDTPSVGRHPVNVTASGSGVFEGENSWRMLEIAVAGTGTDTTPPDITLGGANPYTVQAGSTYADPGYSCADETDAVGDLRLELDDSGLDVNAPGTYTVTYTCTDLSGNMATDTRTVMVVAAGPPADTTDPVIAINGSSELTITAGTAYTEQGATCTDDTDGSLQVTTTGTVDTSSPGTYTVTYACTDSSGNGSTISRTVTVVDTTDPVIAINGSSELTIQAGSTYTEQGAACTDDTDGSLQVTTTGTVDTSSPGTYTVTYACTDSSGNGSTISRTVTVVAAETPIDTTDPVIAINGSSELTITAGTAYTEQGAACTDDTDGSLQVTTTGTVDTSSPGTYTVTYACTDSSGNGSTISRTVTVVDTTDPVIAINGSSELTITAGTAYTEQGATCTDDTDGSLQVTTTGTVDTSSPGTYTVTYACTDSSGNGSTISRTVTVVDTTDPVIAINGSSELTIQAGSTYEDAGATCTDETDGSLTPITISDTVDTSSPGTYTVTYACTDSSGNGSTISRTVTVVDTTDPVITLNGPPELTIQAGSTYEDAGATCTDETDGSLTPITISDTVDTSSPGTYTVTYACTDSSGNGSAISRTVTVVAAETPIDTTDPVIAINGSPELTITAGTAYTEQGATCTDDTDGSLQVTITGTVNAAAPGTYTVTYACTDSSGNNAAAVTRTVTVIAMDTEPPEDTTPPRIDITGQSLVRLYVGDAYVEQGARCIDDVDGTWNAEIHKSTVDTSSAGSYIVIYECADSSDNVSLKIRQVEVYLEEPSVNLPPVITLNGPSTVTVAVGSAFDDPGATCTDPEGGSLEVIVRGGDPDTSSAGKRHIHYSCTDSDGKTDSVVRAVIVQ